MRDLLSWNVSLGRWAGVQVRLHVFFLLFAIFALSLATRYEVLPYTAASLGILLASVLAHEFGHCAAAWKTGGTAEQILLWPFGGLSHVNVSPDPRNELITALAGPLVNLCVCLLLLPVLIVTERDPHQLWELLNPLAPPIPALGGVSWLDCVRMAFWTNLLLLMVNLLPAFPLDGGRALRAVLWPRCGYRSAVQHVVLAAKLTAIALWIVAALVSESHWFASLPLALIGVLLFFSAKQEAERLFDHDSGDGLLGYDFSQGYTSLERNYHAARQREPGPFRRWLEVRKAARLERQQQREEEEERRVDEILTRLHETGLAGLSEEDRALLDRVSARYRNRQRG